MFTLTLGEKTLNVYLKDNKKHVHDFFDTLPLSDKNIYWDKGVFDEHFEKLKDNKDFNNQFISYHLGLFIIYFRKLREDNENDTDSITRFLLKNILFNRSIPDYRISNKYDDTNKYNLDNIKMFPSLETLSKIYKDYAKTHNETWTCYTCNNDVDMYVSCILHFTTRGYFLKWCPNCRKYFFTKDVKKEFCDRTQYKKNGNETTCKKQYYSNKEQKRINGDITVQLDKKLQNRYRLRDKRNRGFNYLGRYIKMRDKAKKVISREKYIEQLEGWISEDPIPIRMLGW